MREVPELIQIRLRSYQGHNSGLSLLLCRVEAVDPLGDSSNLIFLDAQLPMSGVDLLGEIGVHARPRRSDPNFSVRGGNAMTGKTRRGTIVRE